MGAVTLRRRAMAGLAMALASLSLIAPARSQPAISKRAPVVNHAASGSIDSVDAVGQWREMIAEASTRFGVPPAWIEQVIRAESRGMTVWQGRPITSRAGAMGLMQLMPATWASMRSALGLGGNPYQPRDNILAGTAYLRAMYDRFGYPGLFGAYNAGPGRYGASLREGRPLPGETRNYLAKITQATAGSGQNAVKNDETRPELQRQSGMFVVLIQQADREVFPANFAAETPVHDPMFVVRHVP